MKRIAALLTAIACLMVFGGCQPTMNDIIETEAHITGVVKQVFENSILMESGGSEYSVSLQAEHPDSYRSPNVGDEIVVYYDGSIAETYPAQILKVYAITLQTPGTDTAKWGVTLSAANVLPTGLTLVCQQSGGNPTGALQTGSYYVVEVLQNGIWQKATQLAQEATIGWTMEAWPIHQNTTQQWEVDWAWLYGELPAGTYRIGKEIMDLREAGDFDRSMAYAVFTIGDESVHPDETAALREAHPELFDLTTQKGLCVYVSAFAKNVYRCTLLPGTNLGYTSAMIDLASFVDIADMKRILSTYDIPEENIAISAYQHPLSGFYWADPAEDMNTVEALLGLEKATLIGDPLIVPGGTAVSEISDVQLAWANYYNGNLLYAAALNADTMYISSVQHLPIHKMETTEELQQFKQRFGSDLIMDQGYAEVPSFNRVTAAMDDAFFAEYTLLVIFVPANSGSLRFGVNSIYRDDSSICVHVEQTNHPEAVTMDMAGWFLTVPLAKTMTDGITHFDADLGNIPA